MRNEFRFHAVRLWEHRERIRSGELVEFAPLLVLCEDEPGEATLLEERRLILAGDLPRQLRADLLGMAATVARRYFDQEVLRTVFREEMQMLKEASFIDEWIREGEARGEARAARSMLLVILREQFGEIPPDVGLRVEEADADWCRETARRALHASSLAELGLARE